MVRASRWGSTGLEVVGLTATSIDAMMAVAEDVDLSWVELGMGALGAVCLRRRLIYTVLSPPYDGPVNWGEGVEVAENRLW